MTNEKLEKRIQLRLTTAEYNAMVDARAPADTFNGKESLNTTARRLLALGLNLNEVLVDQKEE